MDRSSLNSLFNNAAYSDLKIKLSDGRDIKVHKAVLCTSNEWFKKACGAGSRFAESKQDTLELKDDSPDAMECVLRFMYKIYPGLPSIKAEKWWVPWQFWLNVKISADKYLEQKLSRFAWDRIHRDLRGSGNIEEVVDAIQALRMENGHEQTLIKLANIVPTYHLASLLRHRRY